MARLTVRLPDSLHGLLAERARQEGVSMNQFLVYALTQTTAVEAVSRQRAAFESLRSRQPKEAAEGALSQLLSERRPLSS